MAWEWSHTEEGLTNALENVRCLSKKNLLTILREWSYHDREKEGKPGSFRLPGHISKLPKDVLADSVWERMSELRLCSNGGHEAYCCPDGCHTVTFDEPKGGVPYQS
jgi:hypothetical protein